MRAITYQPTDRGQVLEGVTLTQYGNAAITIDRPAGRAYIAWDDDSRRSRREWRWLLRQLAKLGVTTLGEPEWTGEGGLHNATGRFGITP